MQYAPLFTYIYFGISITKSFLPSPIEGGTSGYSRTAKYCAGRVGINNGALFVLITIPSFMYCATYKIVSTGAAIIKGLAGSK